MPPKLLLQAIGKNIDVSYESVIIPNSPETLPLMSERSQLFMSTHLTNTHTPTPTSTAAFAPSSTASVVLFITHATVIESLVCALVPGTKFPRGIDLCSVTQLRVTRDVSTGHVIATTAVRTADAEFVKFKSEYELGTTGFRFAKKPFPPRTLFDSICSPQLDQFEDAIVVALPAEALQGEETPREGIDSDMDDGSTPRALTPLGTKRLQDGTIDIPKQVKMEAKRRAFVAFADENGLLPTNKAIYLAHYYGLSPSVEDIHKFQRQGEGFSYKEFQQFLKAVEHPEDSTESLSSFFHPYDPTLSGNVSRTTFENFLTIYGDKLTSTEVEAICAQYQLGNKQINYKEFITRLLDRPDLPDIELGDEYEQVGVTQKVSSAQQQQHRRHQQRRPTETAAAEAEPPKVVISPMESAFTSGGCSREDKISTDEAANRAKPLGLTIRPKDLGDFRTTCLSDSNIVDYGGFVAMVEFVEARHTAFNKISESDQTIYTSQADDLAVSNFGLKQKPTSHDIKQFASKSGSKRLTYEQFLRFCEFAEQRQMAFAALAVGSPGGQSRIPAEKAGMLANKFGFAPSVQDIHGYQKSAGDSMSYKDFMSFLDGCRHREDKDTDSMEAFFKPYDPQGTGYVSQKVFRNLLFMFGESYTTEQIDVIVRDICGNGDPVNYLTFINTVLAIPTEEMAVDPLAYALSLGATKQLEMQDEAAGAEVQVAAG
eukprot:GHVS01040770.1.p1 GENE.GHVS01040770.1~~GHVS01040770.1.p1  ORF type:complete len:831 (-),score=107.49 GHVS01040770.1:556-2691(-)